MQRLITFVTEAPLYGSTYTNYELLMENSQRKRVARMIMWKHCLLESDRQITSSTEHWSVS